MTLDDAAAILDVTEKHVLRLIREKVIRATATRLSSRKGWRESLKVNGADVRKRRAAFNKRRRASRRAGV